MARRPRGRCGVAVLALLLLPACRPPEVGMAAEIPADTGGVADAIATITPDDFRTRIGVLAHDSLRGRFTPSPGLNSAARYIAREFARFGLEPGGDDGTFVQSYPVNTDRGTESAPNVVGIRRGSHPELRNTYIVFSAHMDHVGVGQPDASGDSIYNGADDDASGTSAVIELAEAFASLDEAPARSIVFLTVSGEEGGLFGSQAFVRRGSVPADRIVANINIDMIGRNSPDTLVVIGLPYSSLGNSITQLGRRHPELGLTVVDDPWPREQFFFRSDHYNFARAGVPAVFFFSGVHEDYHRPSDEVEKIDADKAARIAKLAFRLAIDVANAADPPSWTAAGRAAVRE